MLFVRRAPRGGGQRMALQPLEIWIDAQVEQLADAAHQHAVAEGLSDGRMEAPIVHEETFAGYLCQNHVEPGDVFALACRAASSAMALSTKARARRISNGPSIDALLETTAAGSGSMT
jgi:hypothetical protein